MGKKSVSVYCLAYNHENFIGQTLEGFVTQKTDFAFEVIVHDDASTDGTRQIIDSYAAEYPDIIVPIYQTENQYSKKTGIYKTFIRPRLTADLIAVCEGDDYWCDDQKLQLQYDYMTAHPECAMCVHNTKLIDVTDTDLGLFYPSKKDQNYTAEEIIEAGGSGLFHTSSYMYRKKYKDEMPNVFSIPGIGDYPLSIYLSTCGTVHYIDRIMSARRMNVQGSWTLREMSSETKVRKNTDAIVSALERMDQVTDGRYSESFHKAAIKNEYGCFMYCGDFLSIYGDPDMRCLFAQETCLRRIKTVIKFVLKKMGLYHR